MHRLVSDSAGLASCLFSLIFTCIFFYSLSPNLTCFPLVTFYKITMGENRTLCVTLRLFFSFFFGPTQGLPLGQPSLAGGILWACSLSLLELNLNAHA